jgi:vitamin-K-epoxide reductase (warfarin-sensitive)
MMPVSIKKIYATLAVVNLLALFAALFLTYVHFSPDASDFCVLSEKWNCDIVNKSIYSTLFGIPVSLMGSVAYFGFLLFSIRGLRKDQKKLLPYFLAMVLCATAFALYLTGIEAFVLKTYCLFCVVQQLLILMELGLAFYLFKHSKSHA